MEKRRPLEAGEVDLDDPVGRRHHCNGDGRCLFLDKGPRNHSGHGRPGRRTLVLGLPIAVGAGMAGCWTRGWRIWTQRRVLLVGIVLRTAVWSLSIAISAMTLWQIWGPKWVAVSLVVIASYPVLWFLWMWLLPITRRMAVLLLLTSVRFPFLLCSTFQVLLAEAARS